MTYDSRDAMMRLGSLVDCINEIHRMNVGVDADFFNLVLTAHFGSYHDHAHLMRTKMIWDRSAKASMPMLEARLCSL